MLFENEEILADRIITLLVDEYQAVLLENRKFATRKTYNSIRGDRTTTSNRSVIRIYADKALDFIISGRRPGARLPVVKVGDKFELVPELKEWVRAVGFQGPPYLLARKIAERGIKGVPITAIVLQRTEQKIRDMIGEFYAEQMRRQIVEDIRISFKGINNQ